MLSCAGVFTSYKQVYEIRSLDFQPALAFNVIGKGDTTLTALRFQPGQALFPEWPPLLLRSLVKF